LFYHGLHWSFFLSEVLSALLGGFPAYLVRIVVERKTSGDL